MYEKYGDYSEESFTDFYDYLPIYSQRDDINFYVEWANRLDKDVLELGCGTGRVSIPIIYTGVNVIGLDYSMPMLKKFKSKLEQEEWDIAERLSIIRGDMTNFRLNKKFGLIILPFRPFQHLISVEDQLNCLKSVRDHLTTDGYFIFDVFNPNPERLLSPAFGPVIDIPRFEMSDGKMLTRTSRVLKSHWKDKWNEYEFLYEIEDLNGIIKKIVQKTTMRYFHVEEIELLLDMAGLKILELYGDFDSSPYEPNSPEEIYVAGIK